jgi:hypothetical protein
LLSETPLDPRTNPVARNLWENASVQQGTDGRWCDAKHHRNLAGLEVLSSVRCEWHALLSSTDVLEHPTLDTREPSHTSTVAGLQHIHTLHTAGGLATVRVPGSVEAIGRPGRPGNSGYLGHVATLATVAALATLTFLM